ncbi:MAG: hypothetical protein IH831_03695 [Planctomycetes bacterium]|nr:hypothetical protein [Planctomycetota bacterium]
MVLEITSEFLKHVGKVVVVVVLLTLFGGLIYIEAQNHVADKQCVSMGFSSGTATVRGIVCSIEVEFFHNEVPFAGK